MFLCWNQTNLFSICRILIMIFGTRNLLCNWSVFFVEFFDGIRHQNQFFLLYTFPILEAIIHSARSILFISRKTRQILSPFHGLYSWILENRTLNVLDSFLMFRRNTVNSLTRLYFDDLNAQAELLHRIVRLKWLEFIVVRFWISIIYHGKMHIIADI